ncbi:MAG TPA: hypothetical protein VEO19_13505 [Terriglobia bacterium]|nr:hypothetical protein [Terriglobia bacterium]
MPATDEEWARSYAVQALSDLDAREKLADTNAKKCHRLHFLQMAAEKTCKAHLVRANGHNKVRKSHAYVARNLPIIARVFYPLTNDNNQINQWELLAITRLAREIELLAPACDDGDLRRDNSEYPWEGARGEICTPCEYNFPNIDDGSRTIIRLIKLIRTAAESYSRQE